ncbi:MAG: hypothetical protein OSJ83_07800, partial [Clostridia bacterium]|nr:hypothetical protein [Clostridia bacterium]
ASVQSGGTAAQPTGGATVQSLLVRAKQFLMNRDFNNAKSYCDRVLDIDPENADAWFYSLLVANSVSDVDNYITEIMKTKPNTVAINIFRDSAAYINFQRYAPNDARARDLQAALSERYDEFAAAEAEAARQAAEQWKENERQAAVRAKKMKKWKVVLVFSSISLVVGILIFLLCIAMSFIEALLANAITDNAFYAFFNEQPIGWVIMFGMMIIGGIGLGISIKKTS